MSPQFVVFAVPSARHQPFLTFYNSSLAAQHAVSQAGIDHAFISLGGDPYLAKVRNLCATKALKNYPQMTDFFFLDDDLEFPPEAILKLLACDYDVVAGIYPKKSDAVEFPCKLMGTEDSKPIGDGRGFYKALMVPTGFLRIKRHVLEKMAAQAPVYTDGTGGGEKCWNIFEMGFCGEGLAEKGEGEWWGEDYAFCRKWLEMGGDIWVYPDIQFGHTGTKTWRANFAPYVKAAEDGTAQMTRDDDGTVNVRELAA